MVNTSPDLFRVNGNSMWVEAEVADLELEKQLYALVDKIDPPTVAMEEAATSKKIAEPTPAEAWEANPWQRKEAMGYLLEKAQRVPNAKSKRFGKMFEDILRKSQIAGKKIDGKGPGICVSPAAFTLIANEIVAGLDLIADVSKWKIVREYLRSLSRFPTWRCKECQAIFVQAIRPSIKCPSCNQITTWTTSSSLATSKK